MATRLEADLVDMSTIFISKLWAEILEKKRFPIIIIIKDVDI